jgi:hypothetical protein
MPLDAPCARDTDAKCIFKQLAQNVCWQSRTFGSCNTSKHIGHWRRSSIFDAVAIRKFYWYYKKNK